MRQEAILITGLKINNLANTDDQKLIENKDFNNKSLKLSFGKKTLFS